MTPLIVLLFAQAFYSCSDLLGRKYMGEMGFKLSTFLTSWFFWYLVIRQVATFGQLYAFCHMALGMTIGVLTAAAIFLGNLLGFLFLKEVLSPLGYLGVSLAIVAVFILAAAQRA
jgi:multidrug transporter EmrE-like cation transporter